MHAQPTEKTIDLDAVAAFWEQERAALPERNRICVATRVAAAPGRRVFVVTCMDERATHIDEALGLAPGEAETFASGGGKIDAATFDALFGASIAEADANGEDVSVFLVPHECSHDAQLGCAAFANDTEAQRAFFTALKDELEAKYPDASVHVMALCTTTHKLREIDVDEMDGALEEVRASNAAYGRVAEDVAHAGHGIYVGDAYRAWVPSRNVYFRLSAGNPSLAGNADIALTVMQHHSAVDLSRKPIVLHVDYPRYADEARTAAAAANIDAQLGTFLGNPPVQAKLAAGALKVVKTETDMATWQGKTL